MPKPEEDLIDRLTTRPEVREKARVLLRTVHSLTGPGTGYDIGDAKSGLPAICAYHASKSEGYADITQDVAQKASCLAPKTFTATLKTVKTALLASKKAGEGENNPTAYATLISKHKIGQPLRVEKWMKEVQAALVALPRFQHDVAPRLAESGVEVRIAVFYWVCRVIKLSSVQNIPLVDKYGVSLQVFNLLVKVMEDECVELKESICATVRKMRKEKAKAAEAPGAASTSKTPTSTPSHSRSASPTKSAMRRDARTSVNSTTTTPSSLINSAAKRKVKVAFSLSDIVSASEDDEGIFDPETPSKKKRPRRASSSASSASTTTAAAVTRVMPVSKAQLASVTSSEGEGEGEDVDMADVAVLTPSKPKRRLVAASTSASSPIAGPSTPRRPIATPTHAYRTPPSARIQLLSRLTDDEDNAEEDVDVDEAEASEEDDCDDDALPPSRRFRPVFLDRMQWAQRAPRLAHDRAAAERRIRELAGRWGNPVELLRLASTSAT